MTKGDKLRRKRDIGTKRDRKAGRGWGSVGARGEGYEGMVSSGDDDIDHGRPQELQISCIIEK